MQKALDSIVSGLDRATFRRSQGADLARGSTGVAMFLSYLGRACGHESSDLISECLSDAVADSHDLNPFSLFHGAAGLAWALTHVVDTRLDIDTSLCARTDTTLLAHIQQRPWAGAYDLVGGLVGCGVYALERLDQPAGPVLLGEVVRRLSEIAIRQKDGVAWWTAPQLLSEGMRAACPNGTFNLGVAHGTPGVIALLAQACAAGIAVETARPTLERAVSWLLRQQVPGTDRSSFTRLLSDGQRMPTNWDTLAWCHGDIGVSAALLWAAVSVGEPVWVEEALAIARRAAMRAVDDAGVVDAGLCHGAAGNGHIFNRLYQATREGLFLEAARRWFRRALQFYDRASLGGFRVWAGEEAETGRVRWVDRPGFITGTAGVGLALLAATSTIEPTWDRLLLVSMPPRPDGNRCEMG